ncbi:hypothetical protein DL93DRAFT_2077751 [Clavulina sp. PMI_390]|nr:hypothetical protein DL93DRAFT_2077751 [Clavulina sp. PMI_390]
MSFFGFDTTLDHALLNQGPGGSGGAGGGSLGSLQDEELEVYTFGEAGYDGLAAQLDEGLDELNDETFGDSAPLGAFTLSNSFSWFLFRLYIKVSSR